MENKFILVINCGSSSIKFSLIAPHNGQEPLSGIAQNLLTEQANITFKLNGEKIKQDLPSPFVHHTALSHIVHFLQQNKFSDQVVAVGHRVVHGGERYSEPTLINDDVMATLEQLSHLAPLHNPANITGITAAQQAFSALPQVAVFDTAFHQTMPAMAYLYALPYELYQKHGIRRYGFHGTSHYYVSRQATRLLNLPESTGSFISAHLGNGASICAIENGKSVDTSMGLTPLSGVVMGTRSGDVDPGIIFHLINSLGYSHQQVNDLLNKDSGLLGLSKLSNDCRAIEEAILNDNNQQAKLALDIFCYRIAKQIAAYTASLTSLDGIIFTGGIGENSDYVRQQVVSFLSVLNLVIDNTLNIQTRFGKAGNIATADSRPVLVIPTNEELVIAQQTAEVTQTL
ncbi:acetate kinase [Thalassotalea sp. LPB0316]|uniref:acetate kinase n=1 Tax=Thalassotalea sp. LPB0316 TaxID=2769490 RepID=UPI001866F448|nr:acetate kinase [Thalassotalea sp. LPB0316]QOL25170.1 acetate kinase [Thalassotalea sp. LPB0316]